jgi:hypothetical protein
VIGDLIGAGFFSLGDTSVRKATRTKVTMMHFLFFTIQSPYQFSFSRCMIKRKSMPNGILLTLADISDPFVIFQLDCVAANRTNSCVRSDNDLLFRHHQKQFAD